MKILLPCCLSIIILSSCIPPVSYKEARESAGAKPQNSEVIGLVKDFLSKNLKINNIKNLEVTEAIPGTLATGVFNFKRKGWIICYKGQAGNSNIQNNQYTQRNNYNGGYNNRYNYTQPAKTIKGYIGIYNDRIVDTGKLSWAQDYCRGAKWIKENSAFRGIFGIY